MGSFLHTFHCIFINNVSVVHLLAVHSCLLHHVWFWLILKLVLNHINGAAREWFLFHHAADGLKEIVWVLVLTSEGQIINTDAWVEDASYPGLNFSVSLDKAFAFCISVKDKALLVLNAFVIFLLFNFEFF
jgi:hypothetical protein